MGLLGKVIRFGINKVTLPVSITKDIITLGGVATDQDKPYTAQHVEKMLEQGRDIVKDVGRKIDKI